jgi:hypothetical protein
MLTHEPISALLMVDNGARLVRPSSVDVKAKTGGTKYEGNKDHARHSGLDSSPALCIRSRADYTIITNASMDK